MASEKGLEPSNALLRRVRRHAHTSTLFRAADASFAPEPRPSRPRVAQATAKAMIQSRPSSLPLGRTVEAFPVPVRTPSAPDLDLDFASVPPPPIVPAPPAQPRPISETREAFAQRSSFDDDEVGWRRLQGVLRRHQSQEAAEAAQAEAQSSADVTGGVTQAIAAAETPSPAAPSVQRQEQPAVPLERAWPVQHAAPTQRQAQETPSSAQPLASSAPPDPQQERKIRSRLGEVSAGGPTDSSIEYHLPSRPRPVISEAPSVEPKRSPPWVQKKEEPAPVSPPVSTPKPETVPTEIGPLPADLWDYLGEAPPQPEGVSPADLPAEPSPPAESGAVQRAIAAAETPADHPSETATAQPPAEVHSAPTTTPPVIQDSTPPVVPAVQRKETSTPSPPVQAASPYQEPTVLDETKPQITHEPVKEGGVHSAQPQSTQGDAVIPGLDIAASVPEDDVSVGDDAEAPTPPAAIGADRIMGAIAAAESPPERRAVEKDETASPTLPQRPSSIRADVVTSPPAAPAATTPEIQRQPAPASERPPAKHDRPDSGSLPAEFPAEEPAENDGVSTGDARAMPTGGVMRAIAAAEASPAHTQATTPEPGRLTPPSPAPKGEVSEPGITPVSPTTPVPEPAGPRPPAQETKAAVPEPPAEDTGDTGSPDSVTEPSEVIMRAIAAAEATPAPAAGWPPEQPRLPTTTTGEETAKALPTAPEPAVTPTEKPAGDGERISRAIAAAEASAKPPTKPPAHEPTGQPDAPASRQSSSQVDALAAITPGTTPSEPEATTPTKAPQLDEVSAAGSANEAAIMRAIAAAEAPTAPTSTTTGDERPSARPSERPASTRPTAKPAPTTAPVSQVQRTPAPKGESEKGTDTEPGAPPQATMSTRSPGTTPEVQSATKAAVMRAIAAAEAPPSAVESRPAARPSAVPGQRAATSRPDSRPVGAAAPSLETLPGSIWPVLRAPSSPSPPAAPPAMPTLSSPEAQPVTDRAPIMRAIAAAEAPAIKTRRPAVESAELIAPQVSEESSPPVVQRLIESAVEPAVGGDLEPVDTAVEEGLAEGEPLSKIDIDKLAQEVFAQLRRRLDVDWERGRGRW